MRSEAARRIVEAALSRGMDRLRGYGSASRRLSGFRAVVLTIPDLLKLPVEYNADQLQDEDGNFYFLAGYSVVGGDDVLR